MRIAADFPDPRWSILEFQRLDYSNRREPNTFGPSRVWRNRRNVASGRMRSAGMTVLGLWLLLSGLATLVGLGGLVRLLLGALALVAGLLILLGL